MLETGIPLEPLGVNTLVVLPRLPPREHEAPVGSPLLAEAHPCWSLLLPAIGSLARPRISHKYLETLQLCISEAGVNMTEPARKDGNTLGLEIAQATLP